MAEVDNVERKLFGGIRVNTGCVPSKAPLLSAGASHVAQRAADSGVMIGAPIAVDMKKVRASKDRVVRKSNQGVETWFRKT